MPGTQYIQTVCYFYRNTSCRCLAKDNNWQNDKGTFLEKDIIPIDSIHVGDTGANSEWVYVTISPLKCYQSKNRKY